MNEFNPMQNPPDYFYVRVYRAEGKLRLETLPEAFKIPPKPYDYTIEYYHGDNYKAIVCIYFDGVEANFAMTERIASRVNSYFMQARFFKKPNFRDNIL